MYLHSVNIRYVDLSWSEWLGPTRFGVAPHASWGGGGTSF
eukprot:COSAG06_NODE_29134_length_562_cov_0.771058_2_plen_39_part_01